MTPQWLIYACATMVVATGLVGGVFLTFSDFVMRSLRDASPVAGIEAMQSINRTVYRSVFLALFFAAAALAVVLSAYAIFRSPGPAATWIIIGGGLYVVGVFAITMTRNVPMNRHLDTMDPAAPQTATYWTAYLSAWTRWNHVRSVSAAAATTCFLTGTLLLVSA